MAGGRPTKFRDEYIEQARKLALLGATDREVSEFLAINPTEEQWYVACLLLIRQDRHGINAARKRRRAAAVALRRQKHPEERLLESMRSRLWAALKGKSEGKLFSRLGYSMAALRSHLEAQFGPGMSWANYGKWHVDHIRPCAAFDLTDPAQFAECWTLANLQPLWAADNAKKGAKHGAS